MAQDILDAARAELDAPTPIENNDSEETPAERMKRLRAERETNKAKPTPKDSAPKTPSFTQRRSERKARTASAPTGRKDEFTEPLTALYASLGVGLLAIDQHKDSDGSPTGESCGTVILENASNMATALDELAQKNPAVAKALRSLTKASAIGAVLSAHMPVLMAILGNHTSFGDYTSRLMHAHGGKAA